MLLSICGLKGSGKDTIGDYLVTQHGFIRYHFADALKDIVSLIFGWKRHLLEGSTQESREFREKKDEWWSKKLDRFITPRMVLQQMGTELFRDNFHKDIWRLIVERKIKENEGKNIVITDCRFQNEIQFIRSYGGKILFVYRNLPNWFIPYKKCIIDIPKHIHASESEWIRTDFDCEIDNNSTYENLYEQVETFLRH